MKLNLYKATWRKDNADKTKWDYEYAKVPAKTYYEALDILSANGHSLLDMRDIEKTEEFVEVMEEKA